MAEKCERTGCTGEIVRRKGWSGYYMGCNVCGMTPKRLDKEVLEAKSEVDRLREALTEIRAIADENNDGLYFLLAERALNNGG